MCILLINQRPFLPSCPDPIVLHPKLSLATLEGGAQTPTPPAKFSLITRHNTIYIRGGNDSALVIVVLATRQGLRFDNGWECVNHDSFPCSMVAHPRQPEMKLVHNSCFCKGLRALSVFASPPNFFVSVADAPNNCGQRNY